MRYRKLGNSGLEVSEISLGSWLTYGEGAGVERDAAEACVRRAFDVGINFIDTANGYANGGAERFLGEVLRDVPRDSYVLATKVFFPMGPDDKGLSAAQIRKQLDASLQRLQTDHVDLYQCHRYDPDTPLEETMAALTEAVRSGKVRAIGFSEWSPAQIRASFETPGERFTSSQPMYNALFRRPEKEVIRLCASEGISQIVFCPLAQGILTGKYLPGEPVPDDSRAASDEMGGFMKQMLNDAVLEAVQNLRPIADEAGITLAQLSLAWILREQNVASAIIGASRPSQIDDNAAASGIDLDADTLQAIDDALGDVVQR
jgi:aryl-alcohol dehydrogenase-like predicted oxidoreductase